MFTEKQLAKALNTIVTSGDTLADNIHSVGLWAIEQSNLHGNINVANRLLEAMGQKHDKARVIVWLVEFGSFSYSKEKGLSYRNRKDVSPETAQGFIDAATETPYWVFTRQAEPKFDVDMLKRLKTLLEVPTKIRAKAEEAHAEAHIHNEGLVEQLIAVYNKFKPEVQEPQPKQG
jgi:hypothetical protein